MFFTFSLLSSLLFLTTEGAQTCRDFTVEGCTETSLLFEGEVEDETECQDLYCHSIYEFDCEYYIFTKEDKNCKVFSNKMVDQFSTCKIIGGPRDLTYEECKEESDQCKFFIEGVCAMTGTELEQFDNIDSVEKCQTFCGTKDEYKYFVYHGDTKICIVYDSDARECAEEWGPQKPPKSDCVDQNQTSAAV